MVIVLTGVEFKEKWQREFIRKHRGQISVAFADQTHKVNHSSCPLTSVGVQDPESGVFVPLIFMISSRSTELVFNMQMQQLRAQNIEFDPKLFLCDKDKMPF
jgi:hypothetical protein